MSDTKTKHQKQQRRKLWLKVHLWLGLFAGAALVVIGLTGSILVFWQEIDELLNSKVLIVAVPQGNPIYKPLNEIVTAANSAMTQGSTPNYLVYPSEINRVFTFSYQESGLPADQASTINVMINPYTAKVTGTRVFYHGKSYLNNCLIGIIFKLHYALLWKEWGVILVGGIGLLLLISVLTGFIVWWPLNGHWSKAFTIKVPASRARFIFDLHKTFGIFSSLVLLAVLISGVYLNLPEQFIWLVERFSTVTRSETLTSKLISEKQKISPEEAVGIAQAQYPEGKLQYLNFPIDNNGTYQICSDDVKALDRYLINTRCLVIDQYSGEILRVMDPANGSAGDLFLQWQWPLHSGQAFGMTGRLLVFFAGLSCPVLYITGLLRWLQKRNAARRSLLQRK